MYGSLCGESVAQFNEAFTHSWNDSQVASSELAQQWVNYTCAIPALRQHARSVAAHLALQDDLVTQLIRLLFVVEKS